MARQKRVVTKRVRVKPTTYKRNGKTIRRKGYYMTVKETTPDTIGFEKLAKEVAKEYVGKPVPKKYQKKYGKRYSKKDALEVGKKVAAKVRMRQFSKAGAKLKTGRTKRKK